jgi:hypothetical protein
VSTQPPSSLHGPSIGRWEKKSRQRSNENEKTKVPDFVCHGGFFRRVPPATQGTPARAPHTVEKLVHRATTLMLEPCREYAQMRRHLQSNFGPERVFQFVVFVSVTFPFFPTITTVDTVHQSESLHLQTIHPTSLLLNLPRASPRSAQFRHERDFKIRAEIDLQETASVKIQFRVSIFS